MSKLTVMSCLLLCLSVFLESYLSYIQYTRDFQRQSSERVQQIIDQAALNIDTYLDDLYRLTLSPYRNAGIMKALEEPPGETELEQLEKRRLIENYLDEIMIYPREDILRVSIVTDHIYSSARLPTNLVPDESLEAYDWYKQALASQEYIFVPARNNEFVRSKGSVEVFSVIKQLRSISNTQNILGVIKADANYNAIVEIVDRAEMGWGGGLFILDEYNEFIYASDETHKGTALSALSQDIPNNDNYLYNTSAIPRTNWKIVAVNSVQEMNREAIQTRNRALMFSIGSALVFILLLMIYVRYFLKPLLSIVMLMKEVEIGKLDVTFQSSRRDEMGYLGSAFNRLVKRIGEMLQENTTLVREVYETKLLQQEAQINALFSQIQPHFIFNTLNMISLSIQSGKPDKANQHIHELSKILRSMSQWDKEIPLYKEVDLLHAYLSIQSSRYEGRLSYHIAVDRALERYPVPALLLQPLVENAVLHGCERKKGPTTITVTAEIVQNRVVFAVKDDGQGIDMETLHRLQRKVDGLEEDSGGNGSSSGIGLVNVNQRIKVRYGQEYGLSISSSIHEGTTVVLTIPNMAPKEACDV
ncbi:cache domain-containing sensor histidine kinase [Paenibacillus abyssi]|uniref:histidine kinase n=1 Tax=Paenibacillus abyssi TaxID=1340531 RepID=A0A917CLD0_9BACL|nr:sensor histidine kinase [Paenibacillus abyssi]GGF90956.1 histidine kinase [Paenibacillus abyssi]